MKIVCINDLAPRGDRSYYKVSDKLYEKLIKHKRKGMGTILAEDLRGTDSFDKIFDCEPIPEPRVDVQIDTY
jgi:hypothetical protein